MKSSKINHVRLAALLWQIFAAATAASQALSHLPNCQDKCGDVIIPYPFGTTDGCFLNEYFQITCNKNRSPHRPYLWTSEIEVLHISLDGQLRIQTNVAANCYNRGGVRESTSNGIFGIFSAFPLSNTRNKFVGIGCDTIALLVGIDGDQQRYTTGCLSVCSSIDSVKNGTCSGIGCCQISIPGNLLNYNITVTSIGNHTNIWDFNPCGYSFLVEQDSFNFSIANLTNIKNTTLVPSLHDWAIQNQTCKEAKSNSTSYACKANSYCYDSDNGPGYRCNCSAGYQGNPYHPDGCQGTY